MSEKSKYLKICTICARAGSQGVQAKNIRDMCGKPLIVYTIEQAMASQQFDRIVISTENEEIARIGLDFGAQLWIKRPMELATAEAGKYAAIKHAVMEAETTYKCKFDIICDLDVTAPLREVDDILESVQLFENGNFTNLITACPSRKSPYFNLVEKINNTVVLSKKTPSHVLSRQTAPLTYDMNASIYLWWRKFFFSNQKDFHPVFQAKTALYEMPEERSIDIDTPLDWDIVEFLIKRKFKNAQE